MLMVLDVTSVFVVAYNTADIYAILYRREGIK